MWEKFHATIITDRFKLAWEKLMLQITDRTASPIFYQYITKVMFQDYYTAIYI